MDVAALILAILAVIVFLAAYLRRTYPDWAAAVPLGLALLTVALICQYTHITGTLIHNH